MVLKRDPKGREDKRIKGEERERFPSRGQRIDKGSEEALRKRTANQGAISNSRCEKSAGTV